MLNFSKSDEETNSSTSRMYIFIFLVNYSFKKTSEEVSHCESQAIQPWL